MSQVPYYASMIGDDPATNYFFKSVPQANAGLRNGGVTKELKSRKESDIFDEFFLLI